MLIKAKEEDDAIAEAYTESHSKRKSTQITLSRKYTRKIRGHKDGFQTNVIQHSENPNGRKWPMCKITLEEKIEILHMSLLEKKSHKEISELMRVRLGVIRYLMIKAKANKNYL